MLLTKEVEVVAFSNSDYYESKGYYIYRYFDTRIRKVLIPRDLKILIKIEDLPIKSRVKITYSCDDCNKIVETSYANYTRKTSKLCKQCISHKNDSCKGRIFSLEVRKRMSDAAPRKYGKDHFNFKDSKLQELRIKERKLPKNLDFVKGCLKRDLYKCIKCNSNKKLNVHHIELYSTHEDLRYEINNGITLCKSCHILYHKLNKRKNCNTETFNTYMNAICN